jgi:RNA polymerase sigma-54 factor
VICGSAHTIRHRCRFDACIGCKIGWIMTHRATHCCLARRILSQQPPAIHPESQGKSAAVLGIRSSNTGRALAGKAPTLGGKTYALPLFFARALPTANGTEATFDIQARLPRIIAAEDRRILLADEAICAPLRNEGVDIARRSVAKYRKCISIPSSLKRRRRNLSEPSGSHCSQT